MSPPDFATMARASEQLIERLNRRLKRERRVRVMAEDIAERGLRELYEKKRQLEFLAKITSMANMGGAPLEVISNALGTICQFIGWQAAHAYVLADHDGAELMRPTNIWYSDAGVDITALRDATTDFPFASGEGLPGMAWETRRPVWIDDLSKSDNFPRKGHAAAIGVGTALGMPLLIDDEVVAVMEFFATNPTPMDADLISVIGQAGVQLGRLIERSRANDRLHDALHDPLTGLASRAQFLRRVERAFWDYAINRSNIFCILFIDLDRFKIINDSLGHSAGDTLIKQVARRLRDCIRQRTDVAAFYSADKEPSLLARMGGDEFTVLLPGVREACDATAIADRILASLRDPFDVEGRKVVMSASIGIAFSTPDRLSGDEVVRNADMAMYHAKALGKSRFELYDAAMHAAAVKRLQLQSDLRAALTNKEFVLHYQPIVSLADGSISGFEALLRWQVSPETMRYPNEFIPVAEETGLIVPIGMWALREACLTARAWNEARVNLPPLTMSVNLSPRQFSQPDLVAMVGDILRETGLDPCALRLEITETVTMTDAEGATEILAALRDLGVRIAIDDFGAGFSCLGYLHRFPVQVLKIDRSFVERMETSRESKQIVKTIIILGHGLGMEVIAEGPESQEQIASLATLGCDYYQGFYFSEPLPADQAKALLCASQSIGQFRLAEPTTSIL